MDYKNFEFPTPTATPQSTSPILKNNTFSQKQSTRQNDYHSPLNSSDSNFTNHLNQSPHIKSNHSFEIDTPSTNQLFIQTNLKPKQNYTHSPLKQSTTITNTTTTLCDEDADTLSGYSIKSQSLQNTPLQKFIDLNELPEPQTRAAPSMNYTKEQSISKKRKSLYPHKSPCQVDQAGIEPTDSKNRSFNLDIYKMLYQSPRLLLYKPPIKNKKRIVTNGLIRAAFRESKRSTGSSDNGKDAISETPLDGDRFKSLFKGQKALPDELRQDVKINMDKFKVTTGVSNVTWKGSNLDIPESTECYQDVTKEELMTCKILRIFPAQYLHIKETMLKQVMKGPFKKRDAQAWFRIDVNKTNRLFDWFSALHWIPTFNEWDDKVSEWMA